MTLTDDCVTPLLKLIRGGDKTGCRYGMRAENFVRAPDQDSQRFSIAHVNEGLEPIKCFARVRKEVVTAPGIGVELHFFIRTILVQVQSPIKEVPGRLVVEASKKRRSQSTESVSEL